METKLLEITEKLYQEGIERGKKDAENIISEAQAKADKILKKAESDAKNIVDKAKADAENLKSTGTSELKMASEQVISALKQEVANLVNGEITKDTVGKALKDEAFIKELMLATVENWGDVQDGTLVVPEKMKKSADDFFGKKAKKLLEKGLTIESANNVKAGFTVSPSDGSFKVSFKDEDFMAFFREFLRPKLVEILFAKNNKG